MPNGCLLPKQSKQIKCPLSWSFLFKKQHWNAFWQTLQSCGKKNQPINAKISGQIWRRNRMFVWSWRISPRYLLINKVKNNSLIVGKPGRHYLNQESKVITLSTASPCRGALRKIQNHFCIILGKNALAQSMREKTSNIPKLRNILQNYWAGHFTSIKVTKQILRNCHSIEDLKTYNN